MIHKLRHIRGKDDCIISLLKVTDVYFNQHVANAFIVLHRSNQTSRAKLLLHDLVMYGSMGTSMVLHDGRHMDPLDVRQVMKEE